MKRWDVFTQHDFKVLQGVEEPTLLQMIRDGKLTEIDCIRSAGSQAWRRVQEMRNELPLPTALSGTMENIPTNAGPIKFVPPKKPAAKKPAGPAPVEKSTTASGAQRLRVSCPKCSMAVFLPADKAGQTIRCPDCRSEILVGAAPVSEEVIFLEEDNEEDVAIAELVEDESDADVRTIAAKPVPRPKPAAPPVAKPAPPSTASQGIRKVVATPPAAPPAKKEAPPTASQGMKKLTPAAPAAPPTKAVATPPAAQAAAPTPAADKPTEDGGGEEKKKKKKKKKKKSDSLEAGSMGALMLGVGVAIISAAVGGLLWYVLERAAGVQIKLMAIGVGVLTGTGMYLGYQRKDIISGALAALIAGVGIFVGQYFVASARADSWMDMLSEDQHVAIEYLSRQILLENQIDPATANEKQTDKAEAAAFKRWHKATEAERAQIFEQIDNEFDPTQFEQRFTGSVMEEKTKDLPPNSQVDYQAIQAEAKTRLEAMDEPTRRAEFRRLKEVERRQELIRLKASTWLSQQSNDPDSDDDDGEGRSPRWKAAQALFKPDVDKMDITAVRQALQQQHQEGQREAKRTAGPILMLLNFGIFGLVCTFAGMVSAFRIASGAVG